MYFRCMGITSAYLGSVAPARISVFHWPPIRQSCIVVRETIVQLGKSFQGGATTPVCLA